MCLEKSGREAGVGCGRAWVRSYLQPPYVASHALQRGPIFFAASVWSRAAAALFRANSDLWLYTLPTVSDGKHVLALQ